MKTPADIPGCIAWIESSGEGAINKLSELTGRKQRIVFFTRHNDQDQETFLLFDRDDLTPKEMEFLSDFATQGTEQFGPDSRPNQDTMSVPIMAGLSQK